MSDRWTYEEGTNLMRLNVEKVVREMMNAELHLEDAVIRARLIALGWTPPPEDE